MDGWGMQKIRAAAQSILLDAVQNNDSVAQMFCHYHFGFHWKPISSRCSI